MLVLDCRLPKHIQVRYLNLDRVESALTPPCHSRVGYAYILYMLFEFFFASFAQVSNPFGSQPTTKKIAADIAALLLSVCCCNGLCHYLLDFISV